VVGVVDISPENTGNLELEHDARLYRILFDCVPVALCQIDTRGLLGMLKTARNRGVGDLSEHIKAHPEFIDDALAALQVVDANLRSVQMFGARNAEELRGPITHFWSESREVIGWALDARYRGESKFEAQIKLRTLDDRLIDALFITDFAPPLAQMGLGLVCFVDISDRVKAQAMLVQVQAEFARAARVSMLGELTASIAHEVSQPLTAISTNTEASLLWLASSPPDVEEIRELCNRNSAEVQRAVNIVHGIRAMAIGASPDQQRGSLNSVIEHAMSFLRAELQQQDVALELDLAPNLPQILADPVQIQQVFVNLALNAVQAMVLGNTPKRRLTIRTVSIDPSFLCAEIDDTGPGIAADHIDRLFQSFFSTKTGGMGIGLSICRSIIEAHGGHIEARNLGAGNGARFRFTLPASTPSPVVPSHAQERNRSRRLYPALDITRLPFAQ
jgi:signal transduction histidine kinase